MQDHTHHQNHHAEHEALYIVPDLAHQATPDTDRDLVHFVAQDQDPVHLTTLQKGQGQGHARLDACQDIMVDLIQSHVII